MPMKFVDMTLDIIPLSCVATSAPSKLPGKACIAFGTFRDNNATSIMLTVQNSDGDRTCVTLTAEEASCFSDAFLAICNQSRAGELEAPESEIVRGH